MLSQNLCILCFGGHPGDVTEHCVGTLAKHAKKGDKVVLVAMTIGEPQIDKAKPEEEGWEDAKKRKMLDFQRAAKLIGAEARCLDLGSPLYASMDANKYLKIIDIIREFKPDLVMTMPPREYELPDHNVTAEAVVKACQDARLANIRREYMPYQIDPSNIYYYVSLYNEYYPGLLNNIGWQHIGSEFIPEVYVDVTGFEDLYAKAYFTCHSDTAWMTPAFFEEADKLFKTRLALNGERCGVKYADAFRHAFPPPFPKAKQFLEKEVFSYRY